MSYNISSDQFRHPLIKPILEELTAFFAEYGIRFYVIGATARDIFMEIHNEQSGRLTHDLDIAIAINDWKQYGLIERKIVELENFSKDVDQKQRFKYRGKFECDIVPYGEIMKRDLRIFWPPDEDFAMSVLGFSAVGEASLKITIDHEIEIRSASLAGIFLLKLVAWSDRRYTTNKDAGDMGFILSNYLEIYRDRSMEYYEEIYTEDHTIFSGGATLLGKDIANILVKYPNEKESLANILNEEIDQKEESSLINQMIETHSQLKYEVVLKCMKNIVAQLSG